MLPILPREATEIISAIRVAGGNGYVVGGALRDLLLGREPTDWDFAATLPADKLQKLFTGARLIGGVCGTVQVPFGGRLCEITPCRREDGYSDRRHPDEVQFIPDILEDLSRRDFTINAMAYDGVILLDPYGGQEDIRRRLLRCVGIPAERFNEDPLRILRLFRFAATLGFTVEWRTFAAAGEAMPSIKTLSRERVRDEIQRILYSEGPQVLAPLIAGGGLHEYGLAFAPSMQPLAEVPAEPLCRWWALMALCGADTEKVGEAFGLSRRILASLDECTRLYRMGPSADKVQLKLKLRHADMDYVPIAATFAAVSPVFVREPVLLAAVLAKNEPFRVKDLAINGDILQSEGLSGERCGQVLDELLTAVIRNPTLNRLPVLLGLARGLKQLL